jgi:MFS family permease
MSRKQLALLFVYCLVPWTVGNGLIPLLPVYATRLGADPTVAGFYLSFAYLALTAGTLSAGWLSDRFQSRKVPLVVAGVFMVPSTWLMGQAADIWQLMALTAVCWLMGGISGTSANILAGLFAGEADRGRVFGLLALTSPLGALIGGLAAGSIADLWGYQAMFTAFAILLLLVPLAGLLLQDKPAARPRPDLTPATSASPALGKGFYLLFAASLAAAIAGFASVLGRSLVMDELGFSATAIASTSAVGAAIALPFPPLAGWLSDRLGRKPFLALAYLAAAAGLWLLSRSISLWHFWVAFSLMRLQTAVNSAVGNALVTDLVPEASLGRGMSLFGATTWIGGIAGFAVTGYAVQSLGLAPTFVIAALLALVSALLLLPIRPAEEKVPSRAGGS